MSKKMIAALVLIALLVVVLLLNPGGAAISVGFHYFTMPKPVFIASFFVGGLITGVLLSGK